VYLRQFFNNDMIRHDRALMRAADSKCVCSVNLAAHSSLHNFHFIVTTDAELPKLLDALLCNCNTEQELLEPWALVLPAQLLAVYFPQ